MSAALSVDERRARLAAYVAAERGSLRARLVRLGLSEADADDALSEATADGLRDVGQVRDLTRLPAWFGRVVRRAGARVRASRRRELVTDAPPELTTELPADPGCRCASRLLERLPPLTRALVERVDVGGERVNDAAESLGLTPNAASVRLFRARARLRELMFECCGAQSAREADATCECPAP
ncbi:MAG: hypothetical protein KF729_02995 [Sandaracinaceae bacterium]|nr:hypothetical protein [Sandaracinaceae bacterium]